MAWDRRHPIVVHYQDTACSLCLTMGPTEGEGEINRLEHLVQKFHVKFLCTICMKLFVHNLFGVFKDLHGWMLGCAFAHLYHARPFG